MNPLNSPHPPPTPAPPAANEDPLARCSPSESTSVLSAARSVQQRAKSVVELVAAQAAVQPGRMAVLSGQCAVSYGELENRANELAGKLVGLGASPETVIGLLAPRSPAMVVGALGILKAGAAYLPLDPSYPEARLAFMLQDAQAAVLVTSQSLKMPLPTGMCGSILLDQEGRMVDAPPASRSGRLDTTINTPNNLAYVIYTSGSTGQPKGVEVTHASLSNLVMWHQRSFQVTDKDQASQVARIGFDAAVWEIWPYLTAGASLHQPDEQLLSEPEALQRWLLDEGISIAFIPTPMAERLLGLPWPAKTSLRVMLTGGDVLHSYAPKDSPFLLVNNYGPTECTVVATSALVPPQDSASGLPPIGMPIQNTQLYVLDESGNQVPPGEQGELYIGGSGLARGYRNRPLLTGQKFLQNPFSISGDRFFKTGDLVRRMADGQFAFLGRLDDQIKIRGFRVEPDEVAAALNEHPAILQSVVSAHEVSPGDRRLVGYFVVRTKSRPRFSELREFLGARLPEFMVPGIFVVLQHIPLTPNGKIDRAALPVPDESNTLRDTDFVAPRTEVERTVAGILANLLGIDRLDVEDNFFALGGHSLLGTQLISRVRQNFGVALALRHVFEAPTVAGIAAQIEGLLRAKLEAMSEDQARSLLSSVTIPNQEGRTSDAS